MKRPNVICHMGCTIDGRILSEHWGDNAETYGALYEKCHNSFESQAWMVGRVTMEKDFTDGRTPDVRKPNAPISRKHYVGNNNASSFAIAVDPSGKLGWDENDIDGDHVIEILTESCADAGTIISLKTAESQMIGGAVGGIGMALMEDLVVDHRFGRPINNNLADYHVPVHADIPKVDVLFVNQKDPYINPIGSKGLGEIALVGVAPAVANAVFNATGKRIRSLPITPDKLLDI